MSDIKEPLRTVLRSIATLSATTPQIKEAIKNGEGFPYNVELLKKQLRDAIDKKLISPNEDEGLTEKDFDSQEDLLA